MSVVLRAGEPAPTWPRCNPGVRDGDEWVLNGQKVWTTFAHKSDFGLCIARTDPAARTTPRADAPSSST